MGPEKGKVEFLNSTLNLSLTQGQKQIVEEHLFKKNSFHYKYINGKGY